MCWPRQYFWYDDWPWDTIGQDPKVVYSLHPSRLKKNKFEVYQGFRSYGLEKIELSLFDLK